MTEDEMVGWHHQFDGHEFEHQEDETLHAGIGKHRASLIGDAGSCCDFGNLFHPSQVASQVAQMVRCVPAM